MKKGIITQSNYIPWKGFFYSLSNVDVFVIYDDMQYTRRDWRNRNKLVGQNGPKWQSIPVDVKGNYHLKIKDVVVSSNDWKKDHVNFLKNNYRKAENFKLLMPWVEEMYEKATSKYLTDINERFIRGINDRLGIEVEIKRSSEFILADEKTERLLNICTELGIDKYYSGPSAKAYMDEELFANKNVLVEYWDYSNFETYNQIWDGFEHGVSVLDLMFNVPEDNWDKMLKIG